MENENKKKNVTSDEILDLQLFSDSLPQNQKTEMIATGLRGFEEISKSLKETISGVTDIMGSVEYQSLMLKSVQNSLKPLQDNIRGILCAADIAGTAIENLMDVFNKTQISTLQYLCTAYNTDMLAEMTKSVLRFDYSKCINIANETLKKPEIAAPDFAFFKNTALASAMDQQLEYPYGIKEALKKLYQLSATAISDNRDIFYDVQRRKFYSEETQLQIWVSTKEINGICFTKCILDDAEEEMITENELIELSEDLYNKPEACTNTEVGKKVLSLVRGIKEQKNEYLCGFEKEEYYHSRPKTKGTGPYLKEEMLKAPIGFSSAGRYNQPGRSHYYFADTLDGSRKEVMKHNKDMDIQTAVLTPIKSIVLLDLSNKINRWTKLFDFINYEPKDYNDKMPREYLIPNYLATCSKVVGFDGIKYYGGKNYSNYVSWDAGFFRVVRII